MKSSKIKPVIALRGKNEKEKEKRVNFMRNRTEDHFAVPVIILIADV